MRDNNVDGDDDVFIFFITLPGGKIVTREREREIENEKKIVVVIVSIIINIKKN